MTIQKEITLPPFRKGFHLITNEIIKQLPELPEFGLVHIFIKHTSAGLTINENADSSVRKDMEYIFNKLIPETIRNIRIFLKAATICRLMLKQLFLGNQ